MVKHVRKLRRFVISQSENIFRFLFKNIYPNLSNENKNRLNWMDADECREANVSYSER